MHATVRYNTLRLAMVILVGGVCYLVGARGVALLALALFISLPLSFVFLARWRHAMIEEIAAGRLGNKARERGTRIDARAAAEDAALDAAEAEEAARRAAADPDDQAANEEPDQAPGDSVARDRREDPPAP